MNIKKNQGFTLIEIAIVLVIIGLLLGGVLKGQELINSAKVKNLATDFRNIPLYIYGYQDRFKTLPGDDSQAPAHIGAACAAPCQGGNGNGVINGSWDTTTNTDESCQFWAHVRLMGLATGPTTIDCTASSTYWPKNADGGQIGIQSNITFATITLPTAMTGTYIICSKGILGKYVKQLDTTMDDSNPQTGSMRAVLADGSTTTAAPLTGAGAVDDAQSYTVCMGV